MSLTFVFDFFQIRMYFKLLMSSKDSLNKAIVIGFLQRGKEHRVGGAAGGFSEASQLWWFCSELGATKKQEAML